MKEFILQLLEREGRPLSISEIFDEFRLAGYASIRASVRGRLNELTWQNRILRVGHGLYASPTTKKDRESDDTLAVQIDDCDALSEAKSPETQTIHATQFTSDGNRPVGVDYGKSQSNLSNDVNA